MTEEIQEKDTMTSEAETQRRLKRLEELMRKPSIHEQIEKSLAEAQAEIQERKDKERAQTEAILKRQREEDKLNLKRAHITNRVYEVSRALQIDLVSARKLVNAEMQELAQAKQKEKSN